MSSISSAVLQPMVLSALLILVLGTVIGLTRFYFVGTKKYSYSTLTPGAPQGPAWYSSINRVYINAIESFAVAVPAFILHLLVGSQFMDILGTIAWVYFLGRLVYALVYVLGGYKIWCSFVWLVSFGATLVMWALLLV